MAQDENSKNCCETGARSGGQAHDPECAARKYRETLRKYHESRIAVWDAALRQTGPLQEMEERPTLRDQFAMAAMTSMDAMLSPEEAARAAYEYADAMLAARAK